MYKAVGLFFEEVWLHRRNKFIAVGGSAVFAVFIMVALLQIPWVPEPVKTTAAAISGILITATILMMSFYVVKFVWLGARWQYRKIMNSPQDRQDSAVNRG